MGTSGFNFSIQTILILRLFLQFRTGAKLKRFVWDGTKLWTSISCSIRANKLKFCGWSYSSNLYNDGILRLDKNNLNICDITLYHSILPCLHVHQINKACDVLWWFSLFSTLVCFTMHRKMYDKIKFWSIELLEIEG